MRIQFSPLPDVSRLTWNSHRNPPRHSIRKTARDPNLKAPFLVFSALFCAVAAHADSLFQTIADDYSAKALPILQNRCFDCHDGEAKKGELDLERFASLDDVRGDPELWQKVVEQIEIGEMPPKDKEQLTPAQREQLLTWTRNYLTAEAQSNAGDPGPVTLRRLNNAEYTYTIRDLTGITELDPTNEFPTDSAAGEGFTNTGDSLVMSPALLEKYIEAGKRIAKHAVLLEDGFRFSPSITRRDRANAIVDQIRELYLRKLGAPMIDFSYRSGKEVGQVRPVSESEGKLNCAPYIEALIEHRERLNDSTVAARIAAQSGLSSKYLHLLATAVFATHGDDSPLLTQLRHRIATATAEEAPSITEWINGWQEQLWHFQSVGHLGIIRPWLEEVNPINEQRDLEFKLTASSNEPAIELSLTTSAPFSGESPLAKVNVLWEKPRIVRGGKPPVLLRDVRAAAAVFPRYRSEALASIERLLAIAFEARQSNQESIGISALAQRNGVNPGILEALFTWLGIESSGATVIKEPLTGRIEQVAGQRSIQGWTLPGAADLSILGNASNSTWRIPGEAPPKCIVVHPRPERWIAAGWQSPITGPVEINAQVQDRHVGCGNGVTWSLQQQRGRTLRVLRNGAFGSGGIAKIDPVENFRIKEGDLVSLTIGSRDGNHSCDLTEIDLTITSGEQIWSLSADCASTMLAGNPHADSYGNLSVWHFFTGLSEGEGNWQLIPQGSLLAEWMACTKSADAALIAEKIATLAANPAPPPTGPNATLYQQLTSIDGPLFSLTDFGALAAEASPDEIASAPFGLDPDMFDAAGNLLGSAPEALHFTLPTGIFGSDARFAVTGRLQKNANDRRAVQFQLSPGKVPPAHELVANCPITVAKDSAQDHPIIAGLNAFRELFPAAMCYTRIVPIDEVVTLVLYHREDEHLARLMLNDQETEQLDALWNELHFVSRDAYQIVDGLEQILEFATQDADPSRFFPLKEPISKRAAALKSQLKAAEPAQLDALIDFAHLAYRRPLTTSEGDQLRSLYDTLRSEKLPHDEAFRMVLARILASPQFLYRTEIPASDAKQGPVDSWELATRLSYFLTSSAPDMVLREVAASGEILQPEVIRTQTRRLLRGEHARRLAIEFACQWLHIRDFDQLDEKSETQFPEFTDLRESMYEETIRFFTDLFQNDGSILDIVNADYVFVDDALANFYDIPIESDGWVKVEKSSQAGRGGILSMATTLAKQSGASRTSPILRGNWVSETLLGEKLPKPPAGVPTLPATPPDGLTERELIEQHSSDPACAKCHSRIDPYGFALEGYDAIGRQRKFADTKTQLPDGTHLNGFEGLRRYLTETRRNTFVRQFCRKLLGYALGRSVQLSDQPLLDKMMENLSQHNYRIGHAVEMIVLSRQFREIRGNPSTETDQ